MLGPAAAGVLHSGARGSAEPLLRARRRGVARLPRPGRLRGARAVAGGRPAGHAAGAARAAAAGRLAAPPRRAAPATAAHRQGRLHWTI